MADQNEAEKVYDLKSVKLPYLTGMVLRLFVGILESPFCGLLIPSMLKKIGMDWFRAQRVDEPPTFYPIALSGKTGDNERLRGKWPDPPKSPQKGFTFATVHDYEAAYRKGEILPDEVAQRFLQAMEASEKADPPLKAFIAVDRNDVLRQARESTRRIKEGRRLSVFDGVPVGVKDEIDMVPYPTSVGTAFLGARSVEKDATAVARLRAAGALLLGKTNMHEIGIGVTGLNTIHGTPRNPYNPAHHTGGSSSGSGAATAAGLCPVALGADGGGSVRIPSSFCGLVGLKPTFGRISEYGTAPVCWSYAHLGPLAVTATDAALAYAVLAGADPQDPFSQYQPQPTLTGWENTDLSDLTLGICRPWFRHATGDIVSINEALVERFREMGAGVKEIVIPNLEAGRIAHSVTITAEMTQSLGHFYAAHHKEHSLYVRSNLAMARRFTARDYLLAQRVRTRMIGDFSRALNEVDVIITPTTAIPAPVISETALRHDESDLTTLVEIMRFVTPANLTGLPAISFPAGYNEAGLPIGMQAIGKAWQEQTLLRLALAAEQVVEKKPPLLYYPLLTG